jgi:hypothetical protein
VLREMQASGSSMFRASRPPRAGVDTPRQLSKPSEEHPLAGAAGRGGQQTAVDDPPTTYSG